MPNDTQSTIERIAKRNVLEGRLAAAFRVSAETDQESRTVANLLSILESKVADIRASVERHGGKHVPILTSSVRAYADLLDVAWKKEHGDDESAS